MSDDTEGVVKFHLAHELCRLGDLELTPINRWRKILLGLGLVGAEPDRYDGYGFGNLSVRTSSGFLITGTQTGHSPTLTAAQYAEVIDADPAQNAVKSRGETPPSSESMTHAVIYQANSSVNAVLHVHSPDIWSQSDFTETSENIPYGTPKMAFAVQAIVDDSKGVFVMRGHQDGVVAYGTDCYEAGLLLMDALARSMEV